MIKLSKTQACILEVFLENDEFHSGEIEGLSSYDIRKLGIPGRTFDINRDALLYYQLITVSNEKKTGKQTRTWYKLTPIGFFSLVKFWNINIITKKIILKKFSKFIPLIGFHWNELEEIFGENLSLILKHSIEQVDIAPVNPSNAKSDNFLIRIKGRVLEEKAELRFDDSEFSLVLIRKYKTYTKDLKEFVKYERKLWDFDNYDDFFINAVDRLTFVFYFNLLRLKFSKLYRNQIIFEMVDYYKKIKPDFTVEKLFDQKLAIYSKLDITDGFQSPQIVHQKIIDMIKKDEKLSYIMKENLEEISYKLGDDEIIKSLIKDF